jgi:hypothetical protein
MKFWTKFSKKYLKSKQNFQKQIQRLEKIQNQIQYMNTIFFKKNLRKFQYEQNFQQQI